MKSYFILELIESKFLLNLKRFNLNSILKVAKNKNRFSKLCFDNFFYSFHTKGEKCGQCKPGYYGPSCKPCECPSADAGNNFADSCSVAPVTSELVCKCRQGYTGLRCEKCADGYYGDPTQPGGSCTACHCSGNIDLRLTGLFLLDNDISEVFLLAVRWDIGFC